MHLSQGFKLVFLALAPVGVQPLRGAVLGVLGAGWEGAATKQSPKLEPWLSIPVTMWIFSLSTQG